MKLQSQINYENTLDLQFLSDAEFRNKSKNHRNFLSKQLQLGDFVPTDKDGNVLDANEWKLFDGQMSDYSDVLLKHKQALDNVIFEGFEKCVGGKAVSNNKGCIILIHDNGKFSATGKQIITIEDLVKYNLTITPQAIKRFNL